MMKLAICAAVLAACGGGGGGDGETDAGVASDAAADAPALSVAAVEDLGKVPLPSATAVGRDGGTGGGLGGKLLWTFGDTFFSAQNPVDDSNVLSATGAWADPSAPLDVTQPVDANGFPAQLVPYTDDELAANRADATNGWALWPANVIDIGEPQALLVFQRIKRTDGSGFASQGVDVARIGVDDTIATRLTGDLFAPPEQLYLPQLADHGYVYAVAGISTHDIGVALARAPIASATDRTAYQFYDGTAWQPDIAKAAVVMERSVATSISYNAYLQRYLSVTCEALSSTVLLRTAPAIEGPWDDGVEILAGDTGILAPTADNSFNYICVEHPELASAGGKQIVMSYSRPTAPFQGDVRLARITLGP
ncbi:MAG TPA: DUF4185 domain-containing protein [Kofleriaceae bacterium]